MATVTEPNASKVRETASIVIDGATWADYEAMLRIIGDRHIFVNYDHGVMEVMVPSRFSASKRQRASSMPIGRWGGWSGCGHFGGTYAKT